MSLMDDAKKAASKIGREANDALEERRARIEEAAEGARESAGATYGRVKDIARGYAEDAGEAVDRATKEGRRYVDRGRRYVDDRLEDAEDKWRAGQDSIVRQVQEAPLAALLFAGAVGFGLALLLQGRR